MSPPLSPRSLQSLVQSQTSWTPSQSPWTPPTAVCWQGAGSWPPHPTGHHSYFHLLPPPASSYHLLPPPATSCHLLPPPATPCHLLPPPATSCHLLPSSAKTCHLLPPAGGPCTQTSCACSPSWPGLSPGAPSQTPPSSCLSSLPLSPSGIAYPPWLLLAHSGRQSP